MIPTPSRESRPIKNTFEWNYHASLRSQIHRAFAVSYTLRLFNMLLVCCHREGLTYYDGKHSLLFVYSCFLTG